VHHGQVPRRVQSIEDEVAVGVEPLRTQTHEGLRRVDFNRHAHGSQTGIGDLDADVDAVRLSQRIYDAAAGHADDGGVRRLIANAMTEPGQRRATAKLKLHRRHQRGRLQHVREHDALGQHLERGGRLHDVAAREYDVRERRNVARCIDRTRFDHHEAIVCNLLGRELASDLESERELRLAIARGHELVSTSGPRAAPSPTPAHD
jgi:hypothetical protein